MAQLVAPLVSIHVEKVYEVLKKDPTAVYNRKLVSILMRYEGSYQLSHVWDKLLHTDDRHRKPVLMKASDVEPKR